MKIRAIVAFLVCIMFTAAKAANSYETDTLTLNRQIRSGFQYLSLKGRSSDLKACIDSALKICKRSEIAIPSSLYLLQAEYSLLDNDYRDASDFCNLAINTSLEEGNQQIHIRSLLFLASYYYRTGFFQESIEQFSKTIEMAKDARMKGIIPKALEGQAIVFRSIGDQEAFARHLFLMIGAAKEEGDTSKISRGLYLAGTLYSEKLRNFRLSDSLLRECYRISSIAGDTASMSLAQANMGWNFYLARMLDSSIISYERSLKLSLKTKNSSTSANALGNLGNIYRDLSMHDKALEYYNKSLDIAHKNGDTYNLQWVYKDITDLFLLRKDTSSAFKSFVEHKKYSDKYLSLTNSQGLSDARLRYEADSHRKEVELLSLKIKNQKMMMLVYTGLTLFALIIFFLIYRGSKLRTKRRISEMNRTISDLTQANLRQQMNPHFIFNTLNSIQYYMYQNDKIATNNYLTKFTSLMRKVLENSRHTSIPIKDEIEALQLYLELESLRFKDRFDYSISVDEEIDPLLFKIPTMLIQPYVENSICHGMVAGDTKGMLKVDLKLENDHIRCTIEDNGIGREAAMKRKNAQGSNHNSLGTRIVASRLDLVNSLYGTSLKTVYTDLKSNTGEAAGTRVEIHIPIIS